MTTTFTTPKFETYESLNYITSTVTKGASSWEILHNVKSGYISITKRVNGKTNTNRLGKTFWKWSEVVDNYKSISKDTWFDIAAEFNVVKILNK